MQNKFKKLISLILFTQILFCVLLLSPTATNAADSYKFKIPIPGFESVNLDGTTKPLAQYIQAIYKYAIGIVAILATVVMMIGGVVWITAAGDSGRIGEAKQYITGALTGLVLALCSFMILQTVDPDLVKFKAIGIETVDPIKTGNTWEQVCTWKPTGVQDCSILNMDDAVSDNLCAGQRENQKCCCYKKDDPNSIIGVCYFKKYLTDKYIIGCLDKTENECKTRICTLDKSYGSDCFFTADKNSINCGAAWPPT